VFGISNEQNRLYLNLLRQIDAPQPPQVGRQWTLDVYARYGPDRRLDLALPFVSPRAARIPLPPIGVLGLDPNAAQPLRAVVIPQSAGVASVAMTIPNDGRLVGLELHAQALVRQLPGAAYLTNAIADVIVR
jgi:hypothetical protein